jgi:hypothetical protein
MYFSKTRHYYQLTLEALLANNASRTFPWADANQLQLFKETYGPSAFICRYVHCRRSTDGFDTSKKRDEHETAHQRRYRCAYPLCVSFTTGFATKAALNRHNEKYHPTILENIGLAEGIVLALRQAPRRRQLTPQIKALNMSQELQQQTQHAVQALVQRNPESQPEKQPRQIQRKKALTQLNAQPREQNSSQEGKPQPGIIAQLVPNLPTGKRCKVYELRGVEWFDRGTGLCSATILSVRLLSLASGSICTFKFNSLDYQVLFVL